MEIYIPLLYATDLFRDVLFKLTLTLAASLILMNCLPRIIVKGDWVGVVGMSSTISEEC